jgi:hypothetical protein
MNSLDLIMALLDAGCWIIRKGDGRNNVYYSPMTNKYFTVPTLKGPLPMSCVSRISLVAGLVNKEATV